MSQFTSQGIPYPGVGGKSAQQWPYTPIQREPARLGDSHIEKGILEIRMRSAFMAKESLLTMSQITSQGIPYPGVGGKSAQQWPYTPVQWERTGKGVSCTAHTHYQYERAYDKQRVIPHVTVHITGNTIPRGGRQVSAAVAIYAYTMGANECRYEMHCTRAFRIRKCWNGQAHRMSAR